MEVTKIWAGLKRPRRVWDTRDSVRWGRLRRSMSARSDDRWGCLRRGRSRIVRRAVDFFGRGRLGNLIWRSM
eukprot:1814261-Pyramimonas_sp.AAC.1